MKIEEGKFSIALSNEELSTLNNNPKELVPALNNSVLFTESDIRIKLNSEFYEQLKNQELLTEDGFTIKLEPTKVKGEYRIIDVKPKPL